jgi:RNA polymerase sigma factor (sigma-70 family)
LYRLILDRYGTHVYHAVYAVVRHPKDAEDVSQEAFMSIYNALSQYQSQGFKTWITRIAVNKAIDYNRRIRKQPGATAAFEEVEVQAHGEPLEQHVLRQEQKELIHLHLQEVPPNYREILYAYYIQEKSYQEISAEQGIELKSVESKLYRAREWVRRRWKEEDFR